MTKEDVRMAFIELAHREVMNKSCYLWGGQGESVLSTAPKQVEKMETTKNNASRVLKHVASLLGLYDLSQAKYFDCSGLVVYLLMTLNLIKTDYTANGIYNSLCYAIGKDELKDGDLVFINSAGKKTHVGIYTSKYGVIEAAGRDVGVVENPISNKWNCYGRLKCMK